MIAPPYAAAIVLLNAHVLTMAPAHPEASALAIVDGRIAYAGADAAAARKIAGVGAEVIDAGGRTVMPGFNDAHAHFGLSLTLGSDHGVDLPDGLSKREFIARVKGASAALPDDKFLFIKILHLPDGFARASDLDFVSRPLFVVTSRGGLLNRRGVERGGFDPDEAPRGFVRGRELAAALDRLVKSLPLGVLQAGARAFLERLARDGITSVQLIDEVPDLFEGLRRKGELTARVRLIPLGYRFDTRTYQPTWSGPAPEWVRVEGVKYFHDDGARITRHELEEIFELNVAAKRQVVVHVLSRHALDTLLDGIEALARAENKPDATRLFRVEHADEVTPEQAQRLARLGVSVASNPSMIPEWHHERAFPLRTLLDAGVQLAFGSDWVGRHVPERALEPLSAVELAVTHGGLGCAECITAAEALRAFTVGSAAAEGMSSVKGTLEVGRFADLIVLSSDPLKTAPEKIGSIEVLLTMVGGRVVYRAGVFSTARPVQRR